MPDAAIPQPKPKNTAKARQERVVARKADLKTADTSGLVTAALEVHPDQTAGAAGRWLLTFFEGGLASSDTLSTQKDDLL